jgi:hypothetical protein
MRNLPAVALVASVALGLFAVGCAAPSGGDEPEQAVGADLAHGSSSSSAHSPISKDLLCAAVAMADQSDQVSLATIPESKLKGDALSDFKAFQKGMVSDFPSEAFELPVKLGDKTFTFILVTETNDGGGSMGIYRTDGSTVATESSGESDPFTWSSPADKCDG